MRKVLFKVLRIVGWLVLSIITLLILLILLVRLPAVQQKIVGKIELELHKKLKTNLSLGRVYLSFPKKIEIENFYLEDQKGDTLLFVKSLVVDTDLWDLMQNKITLQSVGVEGLVSNIKKSNKGVYNFGFIIESFSSETQKTNKSSPWTFSIGDVALKNFSTTYVDDSLNTRAYAQWKSLDIDTDIIDFEKQRYEFEAIQLDGAQLSYTNNNASTSDTLKTSNADQALPIKLNVSEIAINQSEIQIATKPLKLNAFIGLFKLESRSFDLNTISADLEFLQLEDSRVNIEIQPSTQPSNTSSSFSLPNINLDELILNRNNFTYNSNSSDSLKVGFDPNHLIITNLSGKVSDIGLGSMIKGSVASLSLQSEDFSVRNLSGDIAIGDSILTLGNLKLKTGRSQIGFDGNMSYPSLSNIINDETKIDIDLDPSTINLDDIAYFEPTLFDSLGIKVKMLTLKGKVEGDFSTLRIDNLIIETGKRTIVSVNGAISNILSKDRFAFKETEVNIRSTRNDIFSILPDSLLPKSIQLPEKFEILAKANGTINDLKGKVKLKTTYGNATVDGALKWEDNLPFYQATINSEHFDIGNLIRQDSNFNKMKISVVANGSGNRMENLALEVNGTIENIKYDQYNYKKLSVEGNFSEKVATAHLEIDDPSLLFILDGSVDMNASLYRYKADLNLKRALLDSLGLARAPLKIKGLAHADFETKEFRKINGGVKISQFTADNSIDTYKLDSLIVTSKIQDDNTQITIDSEIISGNIKGNVDLTTLATAITQHIDQYYNFTEKDENLKETRFTFDFDIKNTDLITEVFVPELTEFEPGVLQGSFDSGTDKLLININIHHLKFAGITADSIELITNSDRQQLKSTLHIAKIFSDRAAIHHLGISGLLADNKILGRFSAKDSVYNTRYLLKADFESLENGYGIHLRPDSLMLNYDWWDIPDQNQILISEDNVETSNFILSKGTNKVTFTKKAEDGALLKIVFSQFNLQTLSSVLDKDNKLVSGVLNGSVDLSLPPNQFYFNTNLDVTDFHSMEKKWGDLTIKVNNENVDQYKGSLVLKDNVNEANLSGTYGISTGLINADIDIVNFDLATIAPIVKNSVQGLSGSLSSKIQFTGSLKDPNIKGAITVKEAQFNPAFLNNKLAIKNETIKVNNSTFNFKNFTITDLNSNSTTLNGSLEMEDFLFYRFDLNVQAKNFLVLNTERKDNSLFYGQLRADIQADIKGSSMRPDIDMDLVINEGSEITYELPETEYKVLDHDNVVRFVNPNQTKISTSENIPDSVVFQGINLNANIDISDKSSLTIVIDPITQDKLFVKGNAALTLIINEKGDIDLAGKYDVSEGIYDFSFYKLVKREFVIEKGSSIIWTGEILDARLDVKASNLVEAAPIDLVINQLANASQEELNRYRQRLPFLVILNIDGQLLEPEISFEIDMPENKQNAFNGNIYARINELNARESDLNKQVFALLILNRFIADNPLQSESGYSLEDNSRRSVSRILSDQLNRLTDNIKSVNLNFNLESYQDHSSGNTQSTTQLELGVSKSLFNNRLEARVEGNVNIEGQQQQSFGDYVGDLILEYKLTPDGRWRVTGFRRSDYDIISGEVIDTGAGIIYIRDYNSFKELFKSSEKK